MNDYYIKVGLSGRSFGSPNDLYTNQGVAVTVEAVSQIKIRDDSDSIKTASIQFLNKAANEREEAQIAQAIAEKETETTKAGANRDAAIAKTNAEQARVTAEIICHAYSKRGIYLIMYFEWPIS